MSDVLSVLAAQTDLAADCAREPIHIPGAIQPHGALVVLDPVSLRALHVSQNAQSIVGAPIPQDADVAVALGLDEGLARALRGDLAIGAPPILRRIQVAGRDLQLLAHRTAQGVIVEFEPAADADDALEALYPQVMAFVDAIPPDDIQQLCQAAAERVRAITGFNRVMVYRFDADWHGEVVAEDGDGVLPSYLGLRFPASDIPAQARELYRRNRLRLIPTADYAPVAVEPALSPIDGRPLDLSLAALRSVSPIHLQYMRNMRTGAAMSISVLVDGQLWGLISCHHGGPLIASAPRRAACDLIGQVLALQVSAKQRLDESSERVALKTVQTEILAGLSPEQTFNQALTAPGPSWARLTGAAGTAVVMDGVISVSGATPRPEQIADLTRWLSTQSHSGPYVTDYLSCEHPPAAAYADVASGLIAAPVSELHVSYVLWFRPEVVRTVTWGGDPRKAEADGPLNPRTSFAHWKERVRDRSLPWSRAQIDSAWDFRNALVNVVLRRAEERAELSDQLQRSNKELEAFSYSVSHDLRAPFRHIVGYAELLQEREAGLAGESRRYLDNIIEAALSAGRLVDDLLDFSHIGRIGLTLQTLDMAKIVAEVRHSLEPDLDGRAIQWRIGALPPAHGDPALLRQAMMNLIANAVKYTRGRDPAVIEVSGETEPADAEPGYVAYTVRDNGVGFDMAYAGKLFGVFQRLHRAEEFEGTGIGLALTRRIIERHGGSIRAEGKVGEGAAFRFYLPRRQKEARLGRS
jgi:light-regulated signal transduction histidine kinase (bacteriophytochrome)